MEEATFPFSASAQSRRACQAAAALPHVMMHFPIAQTAHPRPVTGYCLVFPCCLVALTFSYSPCQRRRPADTAGVADALVIRPNRPQKQQGLLAHSSLISLSWACQTMLRHSAGTYCPAGSHLLIPRGCGRVPTGVPTRRILLIAKLPLLRRDIDHTSEDPKRHTSGRIGAPVSLPHTPRATQ